MSEIIDGKKIAAFVKSEVRERADAFEHKYGRKVGLAVVRVGDDPASAIYVKNKVKACAECNIASRVVLLAENTSAAELKAVVEQLNADGDIDGMLVQLPLPRGMDEGAALAAIAPQKDSDGFHTENCGKLFLGERGTVACTPRGIMRLIESTGVQVKGKHAVVVGRSNIVGKPVAMLLLAADATVTVCHSKTADLARHTLQADILVVAVGKKNVIAADMVKRGAVVIDVGMNRDQSGLCGDVDFDGVKDVAGYITPVPGGVGPMTVAMLLLNTVENAERRAELLRAAQEK